MVLSFFWSVKTSSNSPEGMVECNWVRSTVEVTTVEWAVGIQIVISNRYIRFRILTGKSCCVHSKDAQWKSIIDDEGNWNHNQSSVHRICCYRCCYAEIFALHYRRIQIVIHCTFHCISNFWSWGRGCQWRTITCISIILNNNCIEARIDIYTECNPGNSYRLKNSKF